MRIRTTLCALIGAAAACGGSGPTGGGGGTPPPPPGPATQTITMGEYTFSQPAITIPAGTTVKWVNGGMVEHTATSNTGDSLSWDSGALAAPGVDPIYGGPTPGGSYSFVFTKVGSYPYHCIFHGVPGTATFHNMTGTITVTP